MQKITIIGNLGRDPEDRMTAQGKRVISFSVGVNTSKEVTIWYNCAIWEERIVCFEKILPYLKKGSRVCIIADVSSYDVFKDKSNNLKVNIKICPISINFINTGNQEKKPDSPSVFASEDEDIPF